MLESEAIIARKLALKKPVVPFQEDFLQRAVQSRLERAFISLAKALHKMCKGLYRKKVHAGSSKQSGQTTFLLARIGNSSSSLTGIYLTTHL
jgi:hypothetical protein